MSDKYNSIGGSELDDEETDTAAALAAREAEKARAVADYENNEAKEAETKEDRAQSMAY